ncbi:helix-turn-helix domain-containing protein [Streptomyces sp. NBC_00124]|nr:helix-turn-helix domain-containing protein [Streptomyces sp. NBC_00140]MCX5357616.1 helix-turn-helix domain-containing protein [Streptomyces sp. NBC_00124]
MRARVIELSWSGLRVPAISVELDCSQKTVRCWLHRFNRSGLPGLDDLGGQGRKRRITEEDRSRIISLVKTVPPGRLRWEPVGELWAFNESGPPEWTWILWSRQHGPKGSRWAARRSAASCSPRACAGAAPDPGRVRRTRTSSQKDTDHRDPFVDTPGFSRGRKRNSCGAGQGAGMRRRADRSALTGRFDRCLRSG